MKELTYPFARSVAERMQRHLLSATQGQRPTAQTAPPPDAEAFAAVIDAAFWASLRREEGYSPRISLAYLPPSYSEVRLVLERPLPLLPEELTRLAPAAGRPGIHLGVWGVEGEWCVWGATRTLPAFCFVLEVASPGVLVIKYSRGEESGKFVNFAVLESDQVKILDRSVARQPGSPAPLRLLLGLDGSPSPSESPSVFAKLATSMRTHGRGGSLLVVPAGTEAWRESVVAPIRYSVAPAFTKLADMMRDPPEERRHHAWQERFQRAIDGIAGLTAVDGATVITDHYEVLAFGANIRRRDGAGQAEQVLLTEVVEGSSPSVVPVAQLGGTRHLSAAQFVQDQQNAVAFVASQDGRFTVFAWSPGEAVPRAYRVETLLL